MGTICRASVRSDPLTCVFAYGNAFISLLCLLLSGIRYYPKLLTAIPFTPATGSRMIFAPHLHMDNGQMNQPSQVQAERTTIIKSVASATRELTKMNKVNHTYYHDHQGHNHQCVSSFTNSWVLVTLTSCKREKWKHTLAKGFCWGKPFNIAGRTGRNTLTPS